MPRSSTTAHPNPSENNGFHQELLDLDPIKLRDSVSDTESAQPLLKADDWSGATKEFVDGLPRVWTRGLVYLLTVFAAVLLPWALFAKVDETGTARGRLEPKGKSVELDTPVGGKVAAIKVKEGQQVKANQVLLELESEMDRRSLERVQAQLEGQKNRLGQLELLKIQLPLTAQTQEQQNQARQLEKQAQVQQALQNLESVKIAYNLQKEEKLAQVQQARQAIAASQSAYQLAKIRLENNREKVPRYRQVFEEGAIGQERFLEVEQNAQESVENLAKAQSEMSQAKSRLAEAIGSYQKVIHQAQSDIAQAQLRFQEGQRGYQSLLQAGKLAVFKNQEQINNLETQLATLKSDIAQSQSQIAALKFQLAQRVIRAPISGTIFHLPISKPGAVLKPGEMVTQIAPQGTPLVIKANMPSPESGFIQVGLPVKIKFDAYPFQDYGIVSGSLTWVSPDSKPQDTPQGKIDTFDLEITLDRPYIDSGSKRIALTAGQTATAEVIVRQRRVIDFVLDPFKKLQKGGLKL